MPERRIAITGAAGQIGSTLAQRLLQRDDLWPVAIVRNPIGAGLVEYLAPGCEVRIGSITEPDSAASLLEDCDAVVHCALATVSRKAQASRALNRAMVENIGRVRSLQTAVFLSTVSVYGGTYAKDRLRAGTFERPRPDNEYGRAKLDLERLVKAAWTDKRWFVLRVGHVIGASFDHTRSIVDLAANPHFKLPFDGALASNTVHGESLAAQILPLLTHPVESDTYNAVDEGRTWRDVFDWHTGTLELPRVEGLSETQSKNWRREFARSSVPRDVVRWTGSVGVLDLVRFPAVQQALTQAVRRVPENRIDELATLYKKRFVKGQIDSATAVEKPEITPLLVSDAVPGPTLAAAVGDRLEPPSDDRLRQALSSWADRARRPTWLPEHSRLSTADRTDLDEQPRRGAESL